MAEAHPVGFQWVMEAKRRGATVIHVDPRFTRTSAVADLHVPIRAGTDIAFLGGLIHHVLETGAYFEDYVRAYTNAPMILRDDFCDTEDLDGLFSGFDPETGTYDVRSWEYKDDDVGAAVGPPRRPVQGAGARARPDRRVGRRPDEHDPPRDDTLQHPRCVFQVLKRHFARYTPEMVHEVCGIDPEVFAAVAEALTRNSGRERTSAFCYAVGWTHHTVGVQYIRAASILQMLLGNIGVRAAASSRCAGTPASRAPRTSPRCSTCSRATSRCRTRTASRTWRPTSPRTPATRASGATWTPTS
jgi:formate dehydrogenase major subunit